MLASPGLGSGLDINSIVGQLMTIEQRPLLLLNNKEAGQQAKISAYGSLKGAVSSFQSSVKTLTNASMFSGIKATVADSGIATASALTSAATGTFQIEVLTLAQSQKIKSEAFVSTDTAIGSGTLTIEFGTYNDDDTFTSQPGKLARTITIEPGQSSLGEIRDAINQADAGVTASIVNDGTGNRLVIASKETGLNNALRITVEDDDGNHTDNAGLSQLAYDVSTGGTANMAETVAAQNATMIIDGITISKPSNTISDALGGVTFNLLKAAPGTSTTLTVASDHSKVQTGIETFVNAYNELVKTITDLSRYDPANKQASILTGDFTIRAVQSQLRGALNAFLPGAADGLNSLTQIGINFQTDGTLQLNNAKLNTVLNDPTKNIASFFTKKTIDTALSDTTTSASLGFASRLDQVIEGILQNNGLLDGRIDGINASIRDINKQRESIARRLEVIENRYRAQFTALDTMIASMSQTSSFLQQQLTNLTKLNDR